MALFRLIAAKPALVDNPCLRDAYKTIASLGEQWCMTWITDQQALHYHIVTYQTPSFCLTTIKDLLASQLRSLSDIVAASTAKKTSATELHATQRVSQSCEI